MARLLRDQGYTATGRAQLLAESGVSNGSLYHHFPGGMEELAEAALEASGQAVADALREALDGAPNAALGVIRFLDMAEGPVAGEACPGCPIAPTALESPIISPRLRAARRGASTNGKASSPHGSGLTDGQKTRSPRRPRRLLPSSRARCSSPG
jgi:AcrR family transcriptional regulator